MVHAPPPNDVLAAYLSEEVQPGTGTAERLLALVHEFRTGRGGVWEVPGECWSVELTHVRASLRTEHAIPGRTQHLPLEDFEEALRAWQDFVLQSRASAS
ncbi:YacL family protein [Pyxidicoccus xibeiensis]|uniref:YacL family protein n=1 Tax=Pyxidicoccus xibeiensis TaxID=2906759 RepID=UPI0020A78E96|nr:YacL family protein [Pyxidicoccus xibeiensis]MCP3141908.1 YacL family protein [Pyxidicoccus xibeiensis]